MGENELEALAKRIAGALHEQEADRERRAKNDQERRHTDFMVALAKIETKLEGLEGLPKRVGKLEQLHSAISVKVAGLAAGAGALVSWFMGRSN